MAENKSKLVEIKTKPTTASVEDFINAVSNEQKRKDSNAALFNSVYVIFLQIWN